MSKNKTITKGYKQTEVGVIPDDWEVVRFYSPKFEIEDGDRGKNYPNKNELKNSGYCLFLTTKNVTKNGFVFNEKHFISKQKDKELNKGRLKKLDIVLTTRGTIGNTAYFDNDIEFENIRINSGMVIIRTAYISKYIYMLLNSEFFKKKMQTISFGSAQLQLTVKDIKNIKIALPPKPEQKKIVDILTTWDKAIDKQTSLVQQKQSIKKGLMQKLFSQKIRFKNDNGNDFPDWKEKRVDAFMELTRGKVLAVSKMKKVSDNLFKYPVYSSQTKNKGLTGYYTDYLFENCITWTTDGANAGNVKYREGKFYCTNVCGVLKSEKGYANLCTAEILNSISKYHVSYVGNPKLMNNIMSKIKLFIPTSIKEQLKIAKLLSLADDEINKLQEKLTILKTQKKGLMQQLLTGKIRVKA